MPTRDLSPHEFRRRCQELQFAYLGVAVDKFVDLKFPRAGQYISPVKDKRRRTLRQATLEALLEHRARSADKKRADDALSALKLQVAEAISPTVLNPPRWSMTGANAIRMLAEDFREAHARGIGVTRQDMLDLGWREAQLDQYVPVARETAQELERAL